MQKKYPFYIQATTVLLGLTLFVLALVTLREVLVPLSLSLVLAILLNPLVNRFEKWHMSKIWAIVVSLLLSFILLSLIGYFFTKQIASFSDQAPVLRQQLAKSSNAFQNMLSKEMHITRQQQHSVIQRAQGNMEPMATHAVGTVVGSIAMIFLLPVYTFLFLFYKNLILNFLYDVFDNKKSAAVTEVLVETKSAIQSYMIGLLLEALLVAVLNSTALLILGVKYAILIGVLGALLNMIPYIGGIIAIAMPMIMALITKGGYEVQLGILGSYAVIQFIDNHFFVPYIVSSKVRINALMSIVIVFLGGMAWGVSGMFLSIPFIGILKIVFDRVDELKPWGRLLGDQVPTRHKGQLWYRRIKKSSAVSEKIVGDKES